MIRTFLVCSFALALSPGAHAQIVSNLPRAQKVNDSDSPTGTMGWWWFKLASPKQNLPRTATMPATANFVHLMYTDTEFFVPQLEYRSSTDGGITFSAPKVIHKLVQGEVVWDTYPQLVCDGRTVFIVFRSNVFDINGGPNYAPVAYGSNDMGQTWQGPLQLSPWFLSKKLDHPNSPSEPKIDAAASGGRLHVCYEARHVGPALPNLEELFYSSAEFDGNGKFVLRKSDVEISKFASPNMFDVDHPHIAADKDAKGNDVVAIIWYDDRIGQGNTYNWTFVRVSRDGGDNFDPEVDVAQVLDTNNQPIAPSVDEPDVAVAANSVYCTYQDMRTGTGADNLYLMFSKDGGVTWTRTDKNNNRILLSKDINNDVDQHVIDADGQTVAISWMEEPPPAGQNTMNQMYVLADSTGGVGIVQQFAIEVNVTAPANVTDVNIVEQISVKGRFIAVSAESSTNAETTFLAWSADAGLTFRAREVTDTQRDVDEPYCDVTLNGDVNVTYLEDNRGSQRNDTVVTGLKLPTLSNDLQSSQGVELVDARGTPNTVALALFTGKLPDSSTPPWTLDNNGFAIQITQDIVFSVGISVALSQPTIYAAQVSSTGEAKFPGIPNFSSLIGLPIYMAVATADVGANPPVPLEFSDPVKLR